MPVPDGEDVLLVEQHQLLVVDYAAVQLRIVGLTQGDDVNLNKTQFSKIWNNTTVDVELSRTHRSILHLDLELGVLLANDGKLDADIATLVTAQQTLLEM